MNTSVTSPLAKSVSFDDDLMWLELVDGRTLGVPLAYFPRLFSANKMQRERYIISGGGVGIHWDEIDEDISVRHLMLGVGDQTRDPSPSDEEEKLRA